MHFYRYVEGVCRSVTYEGFFLYSFRTDLVKTNVDFCGLHCNNRVEGRVTRRRACANHFVLHRYLSIIEVVCYNIDCIIVIQR